MNRTQKSSRLAGRLIAERTRPIPTRTEADLRRHRGGGENEPLAVFFQKRAAWQQRAACAGLPTALAVPDGDGKEARDVARRFADTCCAACPVVPECHTYGRATDSSDGVWGGRFYRRGKEVAL